MESTGIIKEKQANPFENFGKRLDYIMRLRQITNEQLGNKTYTTASTIGGYRTGAHSPNVATLARICKELNVSADYLLDL